MPILSKVTHTCCGRKVKKRGRNWYGRVLSPKINYTDQVLCLTPCALRPVPVVSPPPSRPSPSTAAAAHTSFSRTTTGGRLYFSLFLSQHTDPLIGPSLSVCLRFFTCFMIQGVRQRRLYKDIFFHLTVVIE